MAELSAGNVGFSLSASCFIRWLNTGELHMQSEQICIRAPLFLPRVNLVLPTKTLLRSIYTKIKSLEDIANEQSIHYMNKYRRTGKLRWKPSKDS